MCPPPGDGTGPLPWPIANNIVKNVTALFPVKAWSNKTCTLTDPAYGGKGDGTTDNTMAFQKAIADCTKTGGRVDVPMGTYSTGAILLDNNVELHFEMGAIVKFNGNINEYPMVLTRYQGALPPGGMNHSPMVYAYQKTNIAVTGPGVLDATGVPAFNPRVNFFEPYDCTNVYIQGITLQHSHFWQFHPTLCRNVLADGVTSTDDGTANNDGFDPESCTNLVIQNSTIQAHDDATAIKSGRDDYGRMIHVPASCHVFMHNTYVSNSWGMLTMGSELAGGIDHIYGFDLKTTKANYLLQFKGNSIRGAGTDEVHLDTVTASGIFGAVFYSILNYSGMTGPYPSHYTNTSLNNITVTGAPRVLDFTLDAETLTNGMTIYPIGPVTISNSTFTNIAGANAPGKVMVTWTNSTINGTPAH
jgi:polygalacturonase